MWFVREPTSLEVCTWHPSSLAYPGLICSLVDHEFDPQAVAALDWSEAKTTFEDNKAKALANTD